jgi:transcriptional regulator with XRE-family HTH domain
VEPENSIARAARQLRALRQDLGLSQRHLADSAGLNPSLVNRVEKGRDARLSTWIKLFEGLGYGVSFATFELDDEGTEFLKEDSENRKERRRQGLCTGKRRY